MSHLRFSLTSQTCDLLHKFGWLCQSVESILLLCVCVCVSSFSLCCLNIFDLVSYAVLTWRQWWRDMLPCCSPSDQAVRVCLLQLQKEVASRRVMLVLFSLFLTLSTVLTALLDLIQLLWTISHEHRPKRWAKQNPLCSCSTNITTQSYWDISGHTCKKSFTVPFIVQFLRVLQP